MFENVKTWISERKKKRTLHITADMIEVGAFSFMYGEMPEKITKLFYEEYKLELKEKFFTDRNMEIIMNEMRLLFVRELLNRNKNYDS